MSKVLTQIPADLKRGWKLTVNGMELAIVTGATLHNPKFGTLEYGKHPNGSYDSWLFAENNGGGSVVLFYSFVPNKQRGETLHIGLIPENRPNLGGTVLCLPGGFVDKGETHAQTANREAEEETNISLPLQEMHGVPVASNRAFFIADARKGEGSKFFTAEVPANYLDPAQNKLYPNALKIISGMQINRDQKASNLIFLPWHEAQETSPDMYVQAAIGRFFATHRELLGIIY